MRDAEVFWSSLNRSFECWEWTQGKDTRGYGHLNWRGKPSRAHRVAYALTFGEIAKGEGHHGIVVMHKCDNRLCCNPSHLKLGTHADNMADMKVKGRRKNVNAGASNGRAVLPFESVLAIRADPRNNQMTADAFGVSKAQVQRIRTGKQRVSS